MQCRADDERTRRLLGAIDHEPSHRAVRAERAVLATLGGSCTVPVGAFAEAAGSAGAATLRVSGLVASGDGRIVVRMTREGDDPEAVGTELARALLGGGGASIEGFGAEAVAGADADARRDRLPGRGRPGRPGAAHPPRREARWRGPTSCCTTDWSAQRSSTWCPLPATLIDVGKDPDAPAGGAARQDEIARLLVEHGRRSEVVVRLKGGDPFLFGRGGEEIEVLAREGIPWEVVPGVTSAFGVPAAAGIPVTQRGLASSVTVVTGRVGEPGSDHAPDGGPDWESLARAGGTLVILMGMTTRRAIADALVRGGRSPDTPVAVIRAGPRPRSGWRARRWRGWQTSTWRHRR